MGGEEEKLRKQVARVFKENPTKSRKSIAKMVGVSVRTVQRVIKSVQGFETLDDKCRTGRPKGASCKKIEAKVMKEFRKDKSISTRDIAKKVDTSQSMVQRVKKRNNLKTYKKQKSPKRSEIQLRKSIFRARKFFKELLKDSLNCIVMDDETYVKMDFCSLPGPQFYTVEPGAVISDAEKTISMEKFGPKVLVWQAICQCGLRSQPYFTKGTIDTANYIEECLKKRLIPFLKKHEGSTLFWPDLATAHYAKRTIEWYIVKNVNFVPKELNPPNVPELRPVERYWALVKQKLQKGREQVKTLEEFKSKWNKYSKQVTQETIITLMASVPEKVKNFGKKKTN